MKPLINVTVLILVLISAGNASAVFAADAWEIVTPAGTSGYSFSSISTMDDYVYLGTNNGVYRSTNRGTAWSQIISGLGNQTVRKIEIGTIFDGSAYAITPSSPVFAATAGGVFKSTIGNTTWSSANVGLTNTNIKDIQFDQFLATQGIDTTVYAATPAGVFRSDDAGGNWHLVDSGMSGQSVTKIMTDYVTGNIYALTSGSQIYVSSMFSVSGIEESWVLAYSGSAIRDISLLNPLGSISWLAADAGILKSDENGVNWSLVNSGNTSGRVNVMMSDYLDINVTYAGSNNGGVYRTTNEALSSPAWAQISTSLADTAISDIATNPATSLVVYAAGANGVYRLELSDVYADISTTPVVTPDTTNPTVSITAPANNATVSGNTTVTATASDNVGVVGVQFKLNGVNLGAEDTSSPYSISWNTASTTNGAYTLTAVARDATGNTATASTINVTVNNVVVVPDTTLPTVTAFTMPSTAASLTVSVTTLTASDNVAVTGYLITESSTKPVAGAAGWTATAPTNYIFASAGAKTVYAWAKDVAGNVSNAFTSRSVTITLVDTTNPTVSITAPANNATVSGNTTVTATASDNVGVVGVQFKLNGVNLGAEDTSSPYSISWNTASTTNGAYTLTAVARDATGNTATASTINVTVNNVVVIVDTTAPSVPTNFSATVVSANQINLTWTASTDAVGVTGYRVLRRNGSGSYSTIGTTAMTTYTDTTVSPLATYTYRVAAYDAASNTSGNATSLTVTTLPTAPANLSASVVSTSQINVTWTASSEAVSGYEVYRDNNLVTTITHPTASYSDVGLAAGTTYTYTTKSVSATSSIKSVFSNSVSAKTQSKASSGGGGGGGGGSSSTRGCTDPKATNYSAKAKKDNGTCKYSVIKNPTATGNLVTINTPGYTFTVVMGLGSRGTDVMELQKILVSLGHLSETPTGYYGALTEQAVKKFQISKGLEAVGSVGPQTRAALNQITTKGSTTKTNNQILNERITQLLALVQELTKKLLILKAAEGR